MGRDGLLLPAYFAERESGSFFVCHAFSWKVNILNLGDTFEWIYQLMEILNILIITHFKDTLIASVTGLKIGSPNFDSQKLFYSF